MNVRLKNARNLAPLKRNDIERELLVAPNRQQVKPDKQQKRLYRQEQGQRKPPYDLVPLQEKAATLCYSSQEEGIAIGLDIPRLHQPLGRYFRSRRFRRFADAFGVGEQTQVLDIGGFSHYWEFFERLPRVTIVNLDWPPVRDERFQWVVADARKLPFRDEAFDVCFSNSVVEHIPGIENQRAYAAEVSRVGKSYYVQTPYRWFPVEPHLMTPFIHYLPRGWQRPLLMNFTVWGILQRPTPQGCDDFLRDIQLLTVRDLRALFPGADLWKERTLGLLKSISAIRL